MERAHAEVDMAENKAAHGGGGGRNGADAMVTAPLVAAGMQGCGNKKISGDAYGADGGGGGGGGAAAGAGAVSVPGETCCVHGAWGAGGGGAAAAGAWAGAGSDICGSTDAEATTAGGLGRRRELGGGGECRRVPERR